MLKILPFKLLITSFLRVLVPCLVFIAIGPLEANAQTADFSFTLTSQCGNGTATFTDLSGPGVTKWEWNFGNSNYLETTDAAKGKSPSAIYPDAGVYTVTLRVNDGDPVQKQITIYPSPVPKFTTSVASGCEPLDVVLTASNEAVPVAEHEIGTPPETSTVGAISTGAIQTYQWDFQGKIDGVTKNDPVLNLSDLSPSDYGVLLLIKDEFGCKGTVYEPSVMVVGATPSADFTLTKESDCGLGNVEFKAIGNISSGQISEYQWDIGNDDVIESTDKNYIHNFTAPGVHDISLTLKSDLGCLSPEVIKQVAFNGVNSVDFNFTGSCAGQAVTFTDASSAGAVAWSWDFDGDNSPDSNVKDPTKVFSTPGDHEVSLTVTHSDGCVMTVTKTLSLEGVTSGFTDLINSASPANFNVGFTDASTTSSGSINSWSWDFNEDNVEDSNVQNPVFNFPSVGTYKVKLTVSSSNACVSSSIQDVMLEDNTTADFAHTIITSCPNSFKVGFADASSTGLGSISSWSWDFNEDDVEDSSDPNPEFVFLSEGKHKVKLTVTSSNGFINSTIKDFVLTNEKVDFTVLEDKGCVGREVNFGGSYSDSGNDPVKNWDWTFEDGSEVGSGQNVSHTYNTPGIYTVELIISTTKGCTITETKTDTVMAFQKPIVSNVTYPISACRKEGIEFTAEFSNRTDFLTWKFSNGKEHNSLINTGVTSGSIHHFFTEESDNHTLTVTAYENGCDSDPYEVTGIAIHQPIAAFTIEDATVCSFTETTKFTNKSISDAVGTTYLWNFGDTGTSTSKNPIHQYTSAGDYQVSLEVTNPDTKCTDIAYGMVYVRVSNPDFETDKSVACYPAEVKFTNQVGGNPLDKFTIESVEWDFENNGSFDSAEKNPSHTYTTPGSYNVRMKITEEHGCVYIKEKPGFLSINGPIASFSKAPDEACAGDEITFTNTTTKDANDPASISNYKYSWNFGDSESSILENPTHTYSSENRFKVTLEVTDENMCSNSITENNAVIVPSIVAGFTTSKSVYCANENIEFVNTASIINNGKATINNYQWDFDGKDPVEVNTALGANQNFTYTSAGTYMVKQSITSSLGCGNAFTKEITIVDGDGSFTSDAINLGCAPASTTFHANDDDASISAYSWDFGDGSSASTREPMHFYVAPGSYDVTLTVTLTAGCTRTTTQTVFVAGPVGSFSYDNLEDCADPNHEVNFVASNMRDVTSLVWDYGIGVTESESITADTKEKTNTYNYTKKGTKLPILILTDDGTCGQFSYIREDLGRINTSTPPAVDFSKSSGDNICENVEFQFSDLSTLTDGRYPIISWSWDFDEDGIEDSNKQHPKFKYTVAGTYDVKLTVITSIGCTETLIKPDFVAVVSPGNLNGLAITIIEPGVLNRKVCSSDMLTFNGSATTTNGDGTISVWDWTFGDGNSASIQNAPHSYNSSEEGLTKTVTLTVTDNSQCVQSVTKDVSIYKVEADFSITTSPVLRGNSIDFADLSTTKINGISDGSIDQWSWNFAEGTPLTSNLQNPKITYNKIGSNYNVGITVTNNEGCTASTSKTVSVLNNPPIVSDFVVTGNEDTDISIPQASFDTNYDTTLDPAQDPLVRVKIVSLPSNGDLYNGASIISSIGTELNYADLTNLIFKPDADWNGSTTFDYNAHDSYVYAILDARVTINVTQVQDLPVIISDIALSQNKDLDTPFDAATFESKFTDVDLVGNDNPDFQKIKISAIPLASMGTLKLGTTVVILNQEIVKADLGNLVFEPTLGFVGVATFDWNASDGADYALADAQVLINYFNRKPVLNWRKINNVKENDPVSITQIMLEQKYNDDDKNDEPFKKIKISSLPNAAIALFTLDGIQLNVNDEIDHSALDTKHIICQPVDPNFNGKLFFRWNAFDGTEYSDNDTYIRIWYVNSPPVVYNLSKAAVDEDTQVTFVSADFSTEDTPFYDADTHDALTQIKVSSLPANGTLKLSGTDVEVDDVISLTNLANLTYDPKDNYNGNDSFQWYGYDGKDYSTLPALVNLTINPIQDKPIVSNINKSAVEDNNVQITRANFEAKFSDVDKPYEEPKADDLEKIKIVNLPSNGTLKHNGFAIVINGTSNVIAVADIDNGTGLVFVPNSGYEGNSSFEWNGFDGVNYAEADATVLITHNNTRPVVSNHDFGNKLEDVVVTITRVNFETQYSDDNATDTQFEKVNIISLPNASIGKYQLNNVDLTAGDYTYAELLNGLVYTPLAGANGAVNLIWNAYDGTEYAASSATFSFTYVNSEPIVLDFSKAAVDEDHDILFAELDFTSKYSDVNDVNDSFDKIKVTDLPDHGTLKYGGTTVNLNAEVAFSELKNLIFQPDAHWFGNDSFDWKGYDGTDYSTSISTVSLSVNSINDAPVADNESVTILEDQVHNFTIAQFSNSYSDNYFSENSSLDGIKIDPLESAGFLKLSGADVTLGQELDLTDIPNLTFSTNANENGATYATFGFKVYDGEDYSTSIYTMTVNITPINDVPSFALKASPDVSIDEDAGAISVVGQTGSLSEGPANESAQTLNFVVNNNDNTLFKVQPAIDANGKLTFTTADNAFGVATVTVSIKDNGGKANGGVDESAAQSFKITINPVNDLPVATDESITTLEDQTHTFNPSEFSANYSDIEKEAFAGIKITVLETVGALEYNGSPVVLNQTIAKDDISKLKFIPVADMFGNNYDSFQFEVFDGIEYSALAYTMTVNVTPVNDEPTFTLAAIKDVEVDEDSGTKIVNNQVASQVKGPANESSQKLTLQVSHTNGGLFAIQPAINAVGTLTFTPKLNAFGTSTVTVYITDNGGKLNGGDDESATQTFTITVNSINDLPTAGDESVTELEDQTYTFASTDFSDSYSDVETALIQGIKITDLETVGALEYNGSPVTADMVIAVADISKLKFIPVANKNGNAYDAFKFKVYDGAEYSALDYTMTVNITPVNDEPSFGYIAPKDVEVDEDSGANTVNNQVDSQSKGPANENAQNVTLHVSNTNGSLFNIQPAIDASGILTFTPKPNLFGTSIVTVYITDNGGKTNGGDDQSDPQTFTIIVNSINDLPSAANESVTQLEDQAYTFVSSDFSDSYSDVETALMQGIKITDLETVGDLEYNNSPVTADMVIAVADISKLKFIPVANENGNAYDAFKFKVYDGEEYSALDYTMTVNITAVNDEPSFGYKAPKDIEVDEDSGAAAINGQVINQLYGPTNESSQNLTLSISNDNSSLFSVQPTLDASGNLSFTPVDNAFGTAIVSVFISDNGGVSNGGDDQSEPQTFTITVNAKNDPPVAKDDSFGVNEDNQLSGDLQVNNGNGLDSDVDSDPSKFTYTVLGGGTAADNGTITLNPDGTFTYDPNSDFFGTVSFIYQVCDDASSPLVKGCDDATVTIVVNSINDSPVAVDDTNTTDEDVAVNGNVLTNDTDLGDAPVTVVSNTDPTDGNVTVNADGSYTYTPNTDFFGADTFEYTIEDLDGEQSTATVSITVNAANDTPVAVNDSNTTNEDVAVNGNILINDKDLGDAPVKVVSNTNPSYGNVIVNANGTYTYTPDADFFGIDNFNYTIEDVDGDQSFTTVIITVIATNDTPLAVDDSNVVDEDTSVSGNVLTNDTDLGDAPVTVVSNTDPTNGNVLANADGTYTYTPNADFFGTDTFDYTIEDVDGEQSTATVTITVNPVDDDPLAVDDSLWLKEDASISGNVFDNDERLVDIPVVILTNTNPTHGILVINADGTFNYTPTSGYFGNDSFDYTLKDIDGDKSTATVNIVVDPLDYDPIANDDSDTINEDETSNGDLFANDKDFINTPVLIVSNTNPTNGTVLVKADGTYVYTPNADYFGVDTFTYTLEDSDGDQDTATVTITVNSVNDTPIAIDDNFGMDEDVSLSGVIMDNDTNLGDATVSVVSNTDPSNGMVNINPDGTFVYTPKADFFGTDTFTYTIEDADGEQSTATVIITVNSINDLPVAVNDINTTDEDTSVSGNVLTNDTNKGDAPVQVVSQTNPANGTVVINPDGSYTYMPNENFNGIDSFTYTIQDKNGDQSTATVTIKVNPINDTPVATDDVNSTDENTFVTGNVLPNDTDIDLDILSVININGEISLLGTNVAIAGGGIIRLNPDGSYNFDPNAEFDYLNTDETVQVSFTYLMNDGSADSNETTVVITIVGVNDAPIANDDDVDTRDNKEIIISVLDNDSDPDGDDLSVEIISKPGFGNVVLNEDGTLTYIANLGAYCETDQFTYRICDPEGLCDEATVTINIGVNDTDEDSIPDALETLTLNSDGDSDLNYEDLDSDNDGISDEDEAQITDSCSDLPIDTDSDGIPDYLDIDSDNDGFTDEEEGDDDCDGDGIADYIDAYDDCGEYVSIPEGFSPNGDGVNDFFVIKGIKDFPNNVLMIFNRWGSKIFSQKYYQNNWDGRADNNLTMGSKILPEGTYYYIIDLGNGSKPVKGFVYINY